MGKRKILSIDEIRERIVPLLREKGVKRAVLFGSYAKGNAKPTSDIDIMVETEIKGMEFSILTYKIEQALGNRSIDLINKKWIKNSSMLEKEINFFGVKL